METYEIATLIIMVSAGIGLAGSTVLSQPAQNTENVNNQSTQYALFNVVVNGSELNISDTEPVETAGFEENYSNVVYASEDTSWSELIQSMNVEYWRSNSTGNLCLRFRQRTDCAKGGIYLNGERQETIEKRINQGDTLLIELGNTNQTMLEQKYINQELPEEFSSSISEE